MSQPERLERSDASESLSQDRRTTMSPESAVSTNDRRLLPIAIDEIARQEPETLYAEYPASLTSYGEGFTPVTYAQFANAINGAAWLLEHELGRRRNHETVAYIGPSDLRYMIMTMGAVKAGFLMLWTSPLNSLAAHTNLFKQLGCNALATTSPEPASVKNIRASHSIRLIQVPSLAELIAGKCPHYSYQKTYEEAKHEPLAALHTSGSTGLPKPLIYTHEFGYTYVNLIKSPPPNGFQSANALFQGNRVLQVLPPFHASGVLVTLLNAVYTRAVMIMPLAGAPLSGEGVITAAKHANADIAFVLPGLVKAIALDPILLDGLSKLRHVFYAGGDIADDVGDAFGAMTRFFTMFGATEIGNLPQIISNEDMADWKHDDWSYITPHPSTGAVFRPFTKDMYELVIVRDPKLEDYQTCFKVFPDLQEYSLRDLFSKHPTRPGKWRHRGRTDDVVVFDTGENVNPVEMEDVIQGHPLIRSVLLIGDRRTNAALLVELTQNTHMSKAERTDMVEKLWPIIETANEKCDLFARVKKSHVLFVSPDKPMERAGKGTVQRRLTLDLYTQEINAFYADIGDGGLQES